jgi:hypothetical protein
MGIESEPAERLQRPTGPRGESDVSTQSPTRQPSKARDPRTVALTWRSATHYAALSSDGVSSYGVRLIHGTWRCTCRGYAARQTCCHALAAAPPRCFWCDAVENVTVYVNRHDNGAELALCAACFAPKGVQ